MHRWSMSLLVPSTYEVYCTSVINRVSQEYIILVKATVSRQLCTSFHKAVYLKGLPHTDPL